MASTEDRLPDRPGGSDPGRGRRLGIDVGSVRIGVATCDPDGILATPVETVARDRTNKHLRRLVQLVGELEAVEVVVGLPRTLADRSGPAAADAVELADQLARRIEPTPVRLVRRTADHSVRAAVAAGRRRAGERTAGDDRSGRCGRHFAELAGPTARGVDRARRGRGWLTTTGVVTVQNLWRSDHRAGGGHAPTASAKRAVNASVALQAPWRWACWS